MSARTIKRYTQNLTVTIRQMNTSEVIAAGYAAQPPDHLPSPALPGTAWGPGRPSTPLGPGDTYTVSVYAPHPSPAQLAKAGKDYPTDIAAVRTWR